MKKGLVLLMVFLSGVLAGCSKSGSESHEFKMTVPDNLGPEAKLLIASAWPKVKKACPGLDKYGSTLVFDGIEDSLNMPDKEYRKVTVKFIVPEGKNVIPSDYFASGHHCYLDISADGKTVSIAKRPCKAVCLDKVVIGSGPFLDNGDNLRLNLQ